jgi:hypothetical protein
MDKPDSHPSHCCIIHGCKYADPNCTVVTRKKKQLYPCQDCGKDSQNVIDNMWENGVSLQEYEDTKIKEITDAYVMIKEKIDTETAIPADILELMRDGAIDKVRGIGFSHLYDEDMYI